jgi:hypothetical protein
VPRLVRHFRVSSLILRASSREIRST